MPPQRKSPRKPGFDYGAPGGYFVTICTYQKRHIFGNVIDSEMRRTRAGDIAHAIWETIATHRPHITLDSFIVMPNHIHGIVWIAEDLSQKQSSLSTVIGSHKSEVSRLIRQQCPDVDSIVWQGRFHDHFIRTQERLDQIRAYIAENPQRWQDDRYYAE